MQLYLQIGQFSLVKSRKSESHKVSLKSEKLIATEITEKSERRKRVESGKGNNSQKSESHKV